MKKIFITAGIIAVIVIASVLYATSFVYVPEDKNVCIMRFNQVVDVYTEPGLKFKTPFIDSAVEIQKNALIYDLSPSDVLTLDKKAMTVSSFVIWKISDPRTFLQTIVTKEAAESRLDMSVYNSVKTLISSMNQTDAISSRGKDLDSKILSNVMSTMSSYGIEIVDVQIKQFDLPPDNKEAVYNRMISERQKIAATYTAEGREKAEIVINSANKEASVMLSTANATAEQLKAEGESEYMRILSGAYRGADRAEFYEFIRSMDALKTSMTGDKTVFLPMESQLAKWFMGYER